MNIIKKILFIFAILVIAAVAAWNVNFNSPTRNFSDTMLANVEALADETGPWQAGKYADTQPVVIAYFFTDPEWDWSCLCTRPKRVDIWHDEPCCKNAHNDNTACNLTLDCTNPG